jgi:hypothetical protein
MNWTLDQFNNARDGPKHRGTQVVSAAEGRLLLQQMAMRKALPPCASAAPASGPKPSKLRNQPTEYNGVRYDSKAEARRAHTLAMCCTGKGR